MDELTVSYRNTAGVHEIIFESNPQLSIVNFETEIQRITPEVAQLKACYERKSTTDRYEKILENKRLVTLYPINPKKEVIVKDTTVNNSIITVQIITEKWSQDI